MSSRLQTWWWLGLYGVVLAWTLPGRVLVRSDDFSYVESLAATIHAGRWVESDWLAPYNLPLPVISGLLYLGTGNFYWSSLGLSVACAVGTFVLLAILLRPRAGGVASALIALTLAICPLCLHKATEYTGVFPGLLLALAAIAFWQRGWRVAFAVAVLLGFSNRQSALCLLAFPGWSFCETWWRSRRLDWGALLMVAGVLAVAATFAVSVEPNFSRRLVAARMSTTFSWSATVNALLLALVIFCAIDALVAVLAGDGLRARLRANCSRPIRSFAIIAAGTCLLFTQGNALQWETPGLDSWHTLLLVTAIAVAALFSAWRPAANPAGSLFLAGYVLLIVLRSVWWDYYFLEPAAVMLATWTRFTEEQLPATRSRLWWMPAAILVSINLTYAAWFISFIQRTETSIVVHEQSLRDGLITIDRATTAPFGFLAWKLFPVSHGDGTKDEAFSDFLAHVDRAASVVIEGQLVVVDTTTPRRSLHPTGEFRALPAAYRERVFPLDNDEWRAFLGASPP